ncbi:hypothetical protein NDA01_22660 [Trichocoleus desertorum AS-A10]|uniref:hypothetical protein n=1 Tax=Trichocoleus desertorum TaxID=1481672 RepID=UPI003296CD21
MHEVVIVVDAEIDASRQSVTSPSTTARMVAALKQAILAEATGSSTSRSHLENSAQSISVIHNIQVCSVTQLLHLEAIVNASLPDVGVGAKKSESLLLCPLTLNLPNTFTWARQTIYQQCRDVDGLQQLVEQQLGCSIGQGCYWLPIVYTKKGPLYGEAITLTNEQVFEESLNNPPLSYSQPCHLSDAWRQQLYELGYRLLQMLSAPPATYLLQFGFQGRAICFDRLWPFPAAPAIASLGVQTPDLFACHWRCLTGQPILDLVVPASARYQIYSGELT